MPRRSPSSPSSESCRDNPSTARKLGPAAAAALAKVPKAAFAKILGQMKNSGRLVNGWTFSTKTGIYGTDYLQRAFITAIGLGANRPLDAVYPTSEADAAGKPYSGANKYVVHFEKDQLPPVEGFWSLTMYDGSYFFVPNPINRYSISARQALKPNADGSTDLVQLVRLVATVLHGAVVLAETLRAKGVEARPQAALHEELDVLRQHDAAVVKDEITNE